MGNEADNQARLLLLPRGRVTASELAQMPATLKPSEAIPWTRLSRSAFYRLLACGDLHHLRLGHSIRIPTRQFLLTLGVLEDEESSPLATDVEGGLGPDGIKAATTQPS